MAVRVPTSDKGLEPLFEIPTASAFTYICWISDKELLIADNENGKLYDYIFQ